MLEAPSQFWQHLGKQHAQDLEQYGLQSVKRHQALRYFTWRWSWSTLRKSEQMRFLLAHTPPWTWAHCASARADLSDATWRGLEWPRSDRWLYVFATRLLWEFARSADSVGVLRLPEPLDGDPLPVFWQNRLISQDLANTALEVNAMLRGMNGRQPKSVIEVGAGYGRTAHAILSLFNRCRYTIVDIEPAITISRWYLREFAAAGRVHFVAPSDATSLASGSADLGISISSLQEMTQRQVDEYLHVFDHCAAGGVIFLKQWSEWRNPDDNVTARFMDYPIPTTWRLLFNEPAPVQTAFRQAAWTVPAR